MPAAHLTIMRPASLTITLNDINIYVANFIGSYRLARERAIERERERERLFSQS